jgi:hypothetical protein
MDLLLMTITSTLDTVISGPLNPKFRCLFVGQSVRRGDLYLIIAREGEEIAAA